LSGKEPARLTDIQKEILDSIKGIEESRAFYLTGGAALSIFHLNHRCSEDFDFFTANEELVQIFARKLSGELAGRSFTVEITRSFKSFVEMIVEKRGESMRIQLALDSPYRIEETREADGIFIDSLSDLAAGKLLALFGRAAERDFIDVYLIVKEGLFSLDEIIEKASLKDPGMDLYYLAVAFESVRRLPDDPSLLNLNLTKKVDMKELKEMFVKKAIEIVDRAKG